MTHVAAINPPVASQNSPKPAAVLFLCFNRPDLLSRVLDAVKKAGPRELFVSIDGPRENRADDAARCNEVRGIVEGIDWTPVHIKAEPKNLGCGPAVSAAIQWALGQVEEIIVLEDDCLPDPSFLWFCDEMLERYRDDRRVMQISGTNWGTSGMRYAGYSYAFNSFAPIWGWATWRRAWNLFDYRLDSWAHIKSSGLAEGMAVSSRFRRILERDWAIVRDGGGTWDHQWQYAVLRHHGLCVSPEKNLVINLGFREDGTQLKGADSIFSYLPMEQMLFPLRHPPEVLRNASVEAVFERIYWRRLGWPGRLYRWLVRSERLRNIVRAVIRRNGLRPT